MPLVVGLNPYGLAYTVGLHGADTPRANPAPLGLEGFIAAARQAGVRSIELDHRWLIPLSDHQLAALGESLTDLQVITSFWLAHQSGETLKEAVRCTRAVGASLLRFHLTPVLEGGRAALGQRWHDMVVHARTTLRREARRVADAGLVLAIEDHQDFGSEELIEIAGSLGGHVGITLDTGNPFSVGEDPVAFVERAAPLIRHVHLKDYVAQFTSEGYRLIRCPVGEGCVPFAEMMRALEPGGGTLTASVEIAALEARHIRLFTGAWWTGYPPRAASELGVMLGRLRHRRLEDDADFRTPWEREAPPEAIVEYERAQVRQSVDNLRAWGWM
jgi:sugar phosphate isomerase/epimerase